MSFQVREGDEDRALDCRGGDVGVGYGGCEGLGVAEDGLGPKEPLLEERAPGREVCFRGEAIREGRGRLDAGNSDGGGRQGRYGEEASVEEVQFAL